MGDTPTETPVAAAIRLRKEAAAALKTKRDGLRANIGKAFSDATRTGTVIGFEPDKVLATKTADAYLVNFGNKFRNDFIFCDEFLTNFKGKK